MKRTLIHWLGLLGVIGLLSYIAAVVFSPLAYPGYNWKAQAVSDLFAVDAPSLYLWNQLSVLYSVGGIVSITLVAICISNKLTRMIRSGIYIFAIMNWISCIGYGLFPLSTSGYAGTFQDIMHTYVVTSLVVLLSVISLALIMIGGYRDRKYLSLALWATISLLFMIMGVVGVAIVPLEYFGIPERFSVFAATGFNAVLGIYLFNNFHFKNTSYYE